MYTIMEHKDLVKQLNLIVLYISDMMLFYRNKQLSVQQLICVIADKSY